MAHTEPTPEELRLVRVDDFKNEVTGWFAFGATLLFLLGAVILGSQVFTWLREGRWVSRSWADGFSWLGFGYPRTSWIGVQKILDGLMSLPLFTLPLVVAFGAFMAWLSYADRDSEETRRARAKVANWKLVQERSTDR